MSSNAAAHEHHSDEEVRSFTEWAANEGIGLIVISSLAGMGISNLVSGLQNLMLNEALRPRQTFYNPTTNNVTYINPHIPAHQQRADVGATLIVLLLQSVMYFLLAYLIYRWLVYQGMKPFFRFRSPSRVNNKPSGRSQTLHTHSNDGQHDELQHAAMDSTSRLLRARQTLLGTR
jgi:hypothetical protein